MKTIIFKDTKVSVYLFDDNKEVNVAADKTTVGNPESPDFYIADCTTSTCELIENITAPADWDYDKYTYENNVFVLIPVIEPEPIIEPVADPIAP